MTISLFFSTYNLIVIFLHLIIIVDFYSSPAYSEKRNIKIFPEQCKDDVTWNAHFSSAKSKNIDDKMKFWMKCEMKFEMKCHQHKMQTEKNWIKNEFCCSPSSPKRIMKFKKLNIINEIFCLPSSAKNAFVTLMQQHLYLRTWS